MFKRIVFRGILGLALVAVLAAGAAGVGLLAYNAGVTRGLAAGARLELPPSGAVPYAGVPYPYLGGPFHRMGLLVPGAGLLSCLLLFLGFGFIFALVRGLMWGGLHGMWRRPFWGGAFGGRHHFWQHAGPDQGDPADWRKAWEKGYPPIFDEWHRRAHGQGEPPTPPPAETAQA